MTCPQPPLTSIINPCLTPSVIGAYLSGAIAFLIGLFLIILILRQRQRTASHYFLAIFIFSVILSIPVGGFLVVLMGNPSLALFFYRLSGLVAVVLFCSFYWFLDVFLKIKQKSVLVASFIYPVLIILVQLFIPSFLIKEVSWGEASGFYNLRLADRSFAFGLVPLVFWFWGFVKIIQAYRQSHSAVERNRLKYLSLAVLVFLAGMALVGFGITAVFPSDGVASVICVAILSYVVLKYQLVDIRTVVKRGLSYSFLTAIMTGIYLSFSFLLQFIFHGEIMPLSVPTIISTALLIALVFQPLQKSTQNFIDRVFFRRRYDPQKIVAELSLVFSQTLDLDLLARVFIKTLSENLQVGKAILFLTEETHSKLKMVAARNISLPVGDLEIDLDSSLARTFLDSDEPRSSENLLASEISLSGLEVLDLELFLPIKSQEKLWGFLGLGSKISGEIYSLEELDLLETLARAFALSVNNAYLFTQLSQEKNKLEEARAELENRVKERTLDLEELNESLDQQVKARTNELQRKVQDLEKFYKLTVGRELKMIELKKEIKKFKQE